MKLRLDKFSAISPEALHTVIYRGPLPTADIKLTDVFFYMSVAQRDSIGLLFVSGPRDQSYFSLIAKIQS